MLLACQFEDVTLSVLLLYSFCFCCNLDTLETKFDTLETSPDVTEADLFMMIEM